VLLQDLLGIGRREDRAHHGGDEALRRFGDAGQLVRMKWVRQRCQLAPRSVAAIPSTSPGCASEVTCLTPLKPLATNERRKARRRRPLA
jgi:hypothetical protein